MGRTSKKQVHARVEEAAHRHYLGGGRVVQLAAARQCERAFQFLLTLRILEGFDPRHLATSVIGGRSNLDTSYRAIRFFGGVRIKQQTIRRPKKGSRDSGR